MSFFKRNDPNAPAARRGPDAYARLPAEQPYRSNEQSHRPAEQLPPRLPPRDAYPRAPPPQHYEEKYTPIYNIDPCPSDPLALSNRLVVNPQDFASADFVILRNQYIFSIMYVVYCQD
jgi:vesicle-fusing ATPase